MANPDFQFRESRPPRDKGRSTRTIWIVGGALAAAGVIASACCCGGGFIAWRMQGLSSTPYPEQVTLENYNKIHLGMTFQEVNAILGPRGYEMRDDPWDSNSPMLFVWENRQTDYVIKIRFEKYPPDPNTKVGSTSLHTP